MKEVQIKCQTPNVRTLPVPKRMPSVPATSWWLRRPNRGNSCIVWLGPAPKNPHLAIQWPVDYWLMGSKNLRNCRQYLCPACLPGWLHQGRMVLHFAKETTPGPTLVKGFFQSPCFDPISHINWIFLYIHINWRHVTWCCIFSSVSRLRFFKEESQSKGRSGRSTNPPQPRSKHPVRQCRQCNFAYIKGRPKKLHQSWQH